MVTAAVAGTTLEATITASPWLGQTGAFAADLTWTRNPAYHLVHFFVQCQDAGGTWTMIYSEDIWDASGATTVGTTAATLQRVRFSIHAYAYAGAAVESVDADYVPLPMPTGGSAAANIPTLLGPIDGLPDTPVIPSTVSGQPLNAADTANDIADRSGVRLIDTGEGWEVLPAVPLEDDSVLDIAYGVNLISCDSVVDIDQSDWAQSVLMVYDWPVTIPATDPDDEDGIAGWGTEKRIAWSTPQYGTKTLVVQRSGVPATQDIAQDVADILGQRAWLRGRTLEVVVALAAWVRVGQTVRVTLPGSTRQSYWVSEVRHDTTAATTTLACRCFTLDYYPAD